MKAGEILKYNSALFLTGLFAVFVSAASSGLLLQGSRLGNPSFVWAIAALFLGGMLGLWAVKNFRSGFGFVPDYFIILLPITALAVLFASFYPQAWQFHSWHSMIWGFSVGVSFGLLQISNPDHRRTGYPTFALGACVGAGLSMAVLSGWLNLCDVYAVTSCLIAVTPLLCFPEKLERRRTVFITIVLILGISAIAVSQAIHFRRIQDDFNEMKKAAAQAGVKKLGKETEITALLPILLQQGHPTLRILIAEPKDSVVALQLRHLPFVSDVIRTNIDVIQNFNQPFSWHNSLRRILTSHLMAQTFSGDKKTSPVELLLILPSRPLNERESRLFTSEFYQLAAAFLDKSGIIATTAPSPIEAATVSKTMLTAFAHTAVFPGRNNNEFIVAAAQFQLCCNYNELDRRAVQRFEHLGYCRGMLTAFLSPKRQYNVNNKVEKQLSLPSARVNSDLQPHSRARNLASYVYNNSYVALCLLPLVGYCLLRFLLSRQIGRRMVFSSLENGAYGGALTAVVFLVCHGVEGKLFLYHGWLIAIFILGAACAYGRRQPEAWHPQLLAIMSALLPLALTAYDLVYFQEFYLSIIGAMMFLGGLFTGAAAATFAAQMPDSNYPAAYLPWTMLGAIIGGLAAWLLLALPEAGLWWTIGALAVLRLPLIFHRGK